MDGLKLASLGLAGSSRVTGVEEDGKDPSSSSSKKVKSICSSSSSSSSEQSSTINPSKGGELLATGDPFASLIVLVPAPLDEKTVEGGGRFVTDIWEIAPERVPKADFSPKTKESPWFVWDRTWACNGTCVLLAAAAGFHLFFPVCETSGKERKRVEGNGLQETTSGGGTDF